MQYLFMILGIFGLDFKLKDHVERNGKEGEAKEKLGGFLLIKKYHNTGAFLDAGRHRQKAVAALSVLITAILTVCFVLTLGKAGKGLLKWGLTLLLGGAYSNTYDRLMRGFVVDYVSFRLPVPHGFQKIVFNISDFCIMIGALLMVIDGFYRS